MNKEFSKLFTICMLIESIITYINGFFVAGESHYQVILSLILGVIIAVSYEMDLLKLLNIESKVPYIGSILTGILFSRGSNYIYDLINMLSLYK